MKEQLKVVLDNVLIKGEVLSYVVKIITKHQNNVSIIFFPKSNEHIEEEG